MPDDLGVVRRHTKCFGTLKCTILSYLTQYLQQHDKLCHHSIQGTVYVHSYDQTTLSKLTYRPQSWLFIVTYAIQYYHYPSVRYLLPPIFPDNSSSRLPMMDPPSIKWVQTSIDYPTTSFYIHTIPYHQLLLPTSTTSHTMIRSPAEQLSHQQYPSYTAY